MLDRFDRDEIARLRADAEFFWLDLIGPSDVDIDALAADLGWHPLAIEDTKKFGQRPKLDDFDDHMLLVFYGAAEDEERLPVPVEVHAYLSGDGIVTVRRSALDDLDRLKATLAGTRESSEQHVIYRVLDAITDSFFPLLARFDDEIDDLEDAVVREPTDEQLQRLFRLKRTLVALRKVVTPQRDLFARATDGIIALPGLQPDTRDYFRDVYDHLIRISDLLDSYRDLLTGAMDVYLSTVSNRLNVVMKQLTLVATIFLPLTFVSGFFGQNFSWMVNHVDTFAAFAVFGLGGLLVPVVGLLVWFRRSGYL